MATDPRKRQKKLEKRTAKRNEKKHLVKLEQNVGLAERLLAATRFPVLNCQIAESLEETGLGWVMLSRGSPDGRVAVANFLVDIYCLGVKNVFVEEMNRSAYQDKYLRKMKAEMPAREVPPAEARKLLEEAVAYARGIGFPPHHDYTKAVRLFGDVKASDSNATFEFGKNGRPFYASGPYESPERVRQILAILSKTSGPAGPQYMVAVDPNKTLPGGLTPEQIHLLGPDENVPEKVIEGSQAHIDPEK